MRLHEFEAMDIFETMGIPVPRRGVAETVEEALCVSGKIGYPVIAKTQVLVGGRGLAGGIKMASSPEELREISGTLLGSEIKGLPVRKILVAEKAEVTKEFYVGITVDGYSGKPVVVASIEGGIHIEKTARSGPEKIASVQIDPFQSFDPNQAKALLERFRLDENLLVAWAEVIATLYHTFIRYEAQIAEINPLVVLPNKDLLAVDAVLELDNSALSRIKHPLPDRMERIENPLERKGREIGVTYVDLGGDIGLISSGAGLGMASIDMIGEKMKPANFLETGGGITEQLLYKCMELIMMKRNLQGILINIYGGINPIQEGAKGVVRYIKEHDVKIPIVAKALGNHQEETWEIFRSAGVHVVTEPATEKAVERLYELVGKV
ncbi:MAG: succinyl-CoA synthetase subunit beta [Deltaproteobacteria bacterium]|nr:succinyl-CoA synthetase subunit beta [Deltaproteobacteria bacterium]